MKNNKSPGANGVTAEAFKLMNAINLQEVYSLITAFCNGSKDFTEWHQADETPAPKIQNPDVLNKYQIVSLMDFCSKSSVESYAHRATNSRQSTAQSTNTEPPPNVDVKTETSP
jgi:hypothetical protein